MNLQRSFALAALVAATACGDSTGMPDIATIEVTPADPSVEVGLSVQFQARALSSNGSIVSGIDFTWQSNNPSVASIDENGVATGLSVGNTAITASAGGATPGSQVLAVQADQCGSRVDVILSAGQHQAYDGDQCLFLPTGSAGDRYRVAVTRPTLIEDSNDVPDVTLRIDPVFAAQQSSGPTAAAAAATTPRVYSSNPTIPDDRKLDATRFIEDRRIMAATRSFHLELRRREIEMGLRTRATRPNRPRATSGPSRVDPPARDDLFLVLDCGASAPPDPVVLVNFNDEVAIYQDSVEHADAPLSMSSTQLMLDYYRDHVRDFVTDYWGTTPDIDGNDRLLLAVGGDALPDSAAAAVFSGDFLDSSTCPTSNEGEVMYFATNVITAIDDADPSYIALSVMAHEVKHVTSLFHSLGRGAFHPLWVEEGSAEISQTMSSRIAWASVGGPAVGARITGDDIIDAVQANGGDVFPEIWGIVSQLSDVIVWGSTQPNSVVTNPTGASDFHTFYAAGWHWHRFLGDAFGNASTPFADAPLFEEMTDSLTPSGAAAHAQVTGRSFEQLFEDIVVAMSFHGVGPQPGRAFTTWDFDTSTAIFASPAAVAPPHRYPWPVTTDLNGNPSRPFSQGVYSCPPQIQGDTYVAPGANQRCPIGPSGIRFHDFVSAGSGAGAQIRVTGADTGRIVVTRIQ